MQDGAMVPRHFAWGEWVECQSSGIRVRDKGQKKNVVKVNFAKKPSLVTVLKKSLSYPLAIKSLVKIG